MGRNADDNIVYKAIACSLFGMAIGTLSAALSGASGAYCLQKENQTEAFRQESAEIGAIGGCIVGGFAGAIGGLVSKTITSSGFFKEYSPIMSSITIGTSVMPIHLLNSIVACFVGYAILENWSYEMAMNLAAAFMTFLIGASATAIPIGLIGIAIGIPVMTKIIENNTTQEPRYTPPTTYTTFK